MSMLLMFPVSELASLQPGPALDTEQKSIQPVQAIANRSKPSNKRIILIVAAVLLLIAASVLPINAVRNVVATNNAHASATALTAAGATATVRAAQNAMTAYYATATIQAVKDAQATALAVVLNPDPYQPPAGTLVSTDLLNQPLEWQSGSSADGEVTCQFVNSAYQVSSSKLNTWDACNNGRDYSNFAFEVTMMVNQGNCGGLTLRENSIYTQRYFFEVCQNGYYGFSDYTSHSASKILTNGHTFAILQGEGQTNIIAVVANGSQFDLYINYLHIGSVSNNDYSQGYIGLAAEDVDTPTNVTYQNAKMWSI